MKKNLLSIVAVVLAISFSAFTKKESLPGKLTDNAFWYKVDGTNEIIAEYGFVSRESAQMSSNCSGAGAVCDKGYSTDLYNVGDNATAATSLTIGHN